MTLRTRATVANFQPKPLAKAWPRWFACAQHRRRPPRRPRQRQRRHSNTSTGRFSQCRSAEISTTSQRAIGIGTMTNGRSCPIVSEVAASTNTLQTHLGFTGMWGSASARRPGLGLPRAITRRSMTLRTRATVANFQPKPLAKAWPRWFACAQHRRRPPRRPRQRPRRRPRQRPRQRPHRRPRRRPRWRPLQRPHRRHLRHGDQKMERRQEWSSNSVRQSR